MKATLTLLSVLFCLHSFTQIRQIKMSVYFNTDKYFLRKDARNTLNQLIDSISELDITKIQCIGNTDSRADSAYNVKLSLNRTTTVSNYLIEKGISQDLFKKEYFGEEKPIAENTSDVGMQSNRRVDVIVYYRVKRVVIPKPEVEVQEPVVKVPPKPTPPDPCEKDTVLILSNGTQVKMSICEYDKNKGCLDIQSATNVEEAQRMNLSTTATNGSPLESGGMFSIMPKPGCVINCFQRPVKVLIPITNECEIQGASMFDIRPNGRWVQNRDKLNIVTINGKRYYQFLVRCPGKKNVDRKVQYGKTKVKAPKGMRIYQTTFSKDCPLQRYVYKGKKGWNGKYKRKLKIRRLPCSMGKGDIQTLVIDKNCGDTIELIKKPLQNLSKRRFFSCKSCNSRRFLYIFNIKFIQPRLFRKYVYKRKRDVLNQDLDSLGLPISVE